jgi:radical SAM protein with 4Fe4S-binding SPASM domain
MTPNELILKINDLCDFDCTFCSSPSLTASGKYAELDINMIFDYLKRYPETRTIIVNGGDPLMVKPAYYWKLLNHLDENNYQAEVSLTTNLWNYYNNPDKWRDIFRHPKVSICTSFQYGDKRRINKDRVFEEKDFIAISDMFTADFGYRPDFIAVVDDDNLHRAVDMVRLAKYLNVECKLNYANASGRQGEPLPLSFLYEKYIEIYREGLHHWEYNTKQMLDRLQAAPTSCPLLTDCDEHIRVLHPDGKYFTCGSIADDMEYEVDFKEEVLLKGKVQTPLQDDVELHALKEECYSCPMFQICNGCKKHIKDLKRSNKVETHCKKMKTIADDIIKYTESYETDRRA